MVRFLILHSYTGNTLLDDADDITPQSPSSTPCPSPSPQSASPARSGGGSSSSGSIDSSIDPGVVSSAPCRYFVMKCNNQRNLDISQSKGIWATSPANQAKMNRAFRVGFMMHRADYPFISFCLFLWFCLTCIQYIVSDERKLQKCQN